MRMHIEIAPYPGRTPSRGNAGLAIGRKASASKASS